MHLGCTITKTTAAHAPLLRSSEKKKVASKGKVTTRKKKKQVHLFIYIFTSLLFCVFGSFSG